jgi:hypothetical protein
MLWLVCLTQAGTDCSGQEVEYVLGYVEVGGRTAVYAPLCADDRVRGVRVYAAPDPDTGGDFVALWEAESPTTDMVARGFFVLGDNSQFGEVKREPPTAFPRRLSVDVDTVRDRVVAEARERPDELPRYPAGTPVTEMTFDTERGRESYDDLRGTAASGCSG